ncbi:MAG TPA: hypothetical protein VHC69_14305 [Polyangiaceae bacterium]|nr:hypothetical protein [Polyangiaceae bacterium]
MDREERGQAILRAPGKGRFAWSGGVLSLLVLGTATAHAQGQSAPSPAARFDDGAAQVAPSASTPSPTATSASVPAAPAPSSVPPVVDAPPTSGELSPPVEPRPLQREQFDERWQPPPQRRWYGWQTLLVDVPSLSMWITAAEVHSPSSAIAAMGFVGFLFGAPIVHGAHGHWGKFGASIGMRAGTILLAVIGAAGCIDGAALNEGFGKPCGAGYDALLVVGSLGILAAVAVDAAALAREDVPPEHRSTIGITPWFFEKARGGGLSLGGTF